MTRDSGLAERVQGAEIEGSRLWLLVAVVLGCVVIPAALPGCGQEGSARGAHSEEAPASASEGVCCAGDPVPEPKPLAPEENSVLLDVPDLELVNHDGETVRLVSDVLRGKAVAMNFIFTTCQGICPPLGANFAKLQERLGEDIGEKVALVSITVDALIDTPERLRDWSGTFGRKPGWTLLTGPKTRVDGLLKALQVFSADKSDHTPFLLVGDVTSRRWRRVHGLSAPVKIAELLLETASSLAMSLPGNERAHRYFSDMPLIDQHGKERRLYSDLMKDKVVVITFFFSSCRGTCPKLMANYVKLQEHLGERLGRDAHLLAITVDPERDTPLKLASYARQLEAKPGWYFLTGSEAQVEAVKAKFGERAQKPEDHGNLFLIGNVRTGLWKKVLGVSPAESVIASLDAALADNG